MKRCFFFVLLSVLLATAASAGGINLSWDDCGAHGIPVKQFLCNTNSGFDALVASFVSPAPLYQVIAMDGQIDVFSGQATVPSWWDFTSTGCRVGRLNASVDFVSGPFGCVDPWLGQGVAAYNYQIGILGPGHSRIRLVAAVPTSAAFAVDDTTEYYAFRVTIAHAKTVGSGSCPGCDVGACLILSVIRLYQPAGVGDYTISQPLSRQDAYWQCPGFITTSIGGPGCVLLCPVPVKAKTWGAIKGLYR